MKVAKNISQQAIAKELRISRSGISEILMKCQGTERVSDQPRCDHHWKLQHRMEQKLIRTARTQLKMVGQMMNDSNLLNLLSVDAIKHILWEH